MHLSALLSTQGNDEPHTGKGKRKERRVPNITEKIMPTRFTNAGDVRFDKPRRVYYQIQCVNPKS